VGHTYSSLLVHVVFSTKGRRPVIHDSFRQRIYEYMGGIARGEFGRALVVGGTANHVHGLLSMNAATSVAEAMRKWKSLASGWVHEQIPQAADFAWQEGYGAFSVSQSAAAKVMQYIEHQEEHHKKWTFEEEFLALLGRHGIGYDRERIWL
jgi:REP element-mobilizing transposase RayT